MTERYLLVAFDSTHAAIAAERALSMLGAVVMPTLREISASCGMSLRLAEGDRTAAIERLASAGIGTWTLYAVRQEGGRVIEAVPLDHAVAEPAPGR